MPTMPSDLSEPEDGCQTPSKQGGTITAASCGVLAYDPVEEQFPITHTVIVLDSRPGDNDILERFAREIFNKDAELTQVTRPDSLRRNFPTFRWVFVARSQEARTILGHTIEMRPPQNGNTPLPDVMINHVAVLAIVRAEEARYSAENVPNPRSRIFLAGLGQGFADASVLFFHEALGGLGGLIGLAGWLPPNPQGILEVAHNFGPDSDNDNEKCHQFLKDLQACYAERQSPQSQDFASAEASSQDYVSLVRKLRETHIFLAPGHDPIKEALVMSMLLQYDLRFKQVQYHGYTQATFLSMDTLWPRMLADIVTFLKSQSIQPSEPAQAAGDMGGQETLN